ncbi:hypothetical protein C8J56DRAFT_797312 [Mycena floridula]|nr:hypothetical protein C8J56DRAFT_797312 [Mycena floridula]
MVHVQVTKGDVKRKRYESSVRPHFLWCDLFELIALQDNPMATWLPLRMTFLREMLRRDGLGYDTEKQSCSRCSSPLEVSTNGRMDDSAWDSLASEPFRCRICGLALLCRSCCLSNHSRLPLHVIQIWNGSFWAKTSLFEQGLCYQLGHGGARCQVPGKQQTMTIMGTSMIQTVLVAHCGCDRSDRLTAVQELLQNGWYPATVTVPQTCATFECLDQFRMLNVAATVNVRDYVTTLENLTDGMRTGDVADRYKSLGRMSRQYGFLLHMKRSGRGHEPGGIAATKPGETAVWCWACPQVGINLPDDWKDAAPEDQFLYMLFIVMDANFRMKNRLRTNARSDPALSGGMAYQVEENAYKKHLANYVMEEDISTCIAFAALTQKNTRLSTGLRSSGVGSCVCSRHELVRPLGIGDLQKGERYANMDYIFFMAIQMCRLALIFLTYDIYCQYRVNLELRNLSMPDAIRHDFSATEIKGGLPIWHGDVHVVSCRTEHQVQYQEGAGKLDGEAPERVWSVLNPISYATKEMGVGACTDAIDERVDYHNHTKNIRLGTTLQKRLQIAVVECGKQVAIFREMSSSVQSDMKLRWEKQYDAWVEDCKSNASPFAPAVAETVSEAEVRLELRKEEAEAAAASRGPVHVSSATDFLTLALELEDNQCVYRARIKDDMKQSATTNEQSKLEACRYKFYAKLKKFPRLQEHYMPGAIRAITREKDQHDSNAIPPQAEDIKLWLPSQLGATTRGRGCEKGLVEMEIKFPVFYCFLQIRNRLHAKCHFVNYRNTHVVGQRKGMRARGLIDTVGEHVSFFATKYQRVRAALVALTSEADYPHFKPLADADIKLDIEEISDAEATKRLALEGSSRVQIHEEQRKEGSADRRPQNMSWIWLSVGPETAASEVHDSVHVKWSKARARSRRWREEVRLLKEEMRRVLQSQDFRGDLWLKRAESLRVHEDAAMQSGLAAYAYSQASCSRQIRERFQALWERRPDTVTSDRR